MKLDDRGKKLRGLIAEKMIAVAPTEAAWSGILAQIWNVEGEVTVTGAQRPCQDLSLARLSHVLVAWRVAGIVYLASAPFF